MTHDQSILKQIVVDLFPEAFLTQRGLPHQHRKKAPTVTVALHVSSGSSHHPAFVLDLSLLLLSPDYCRIQRHNNDPVSQSNHLTYDEKMEGMNLSFIEREMRKKTL